MSASGRRGRGLPDCFLRKSEPPETSRNTFTGEIDNRARWYHGAVIIIGTHDTSALGTHKVRGGVSPVPDVQYPDDLSNPSTIRIEDLLASDAADAPSTETPVREGLPRSFRMRADKHYVEMLDGPPQRPAATEASSSAHPAGTRAPDAIASTVDVAAAQASRDLAQSLSALRACTNLLSDRGPALTSSVAANLIRAEAWRATCLLQA